jgi:hypothetical protein
MGFWDDIFGMPKKREIAVTMEWAKSVNDWQNAMTRSLTQMGATVESQDKVNKELYLYMQTLEKKVAILEQMVTKK